MQHLRPNTTLQGGKYRIERVLGQGGFGNTYVGVNTVFNKRVAIKEFFMRGITLREEGQVTVSISVPDNRVIFLELKEKFNKEALRIRQLKNEHIVAVHDLLEENGTAYYVMDKSNMYRVLMVGSDQEPEAVLYRNHARCNYLNAWILKTQKIENGREFKYE